MSDGARDGAWRRARLEDSRLYFVWTPSDADASSAVVEGALAGGADIVQLRHAQPGGERSLARLGERVRELCVESGALFVVNDDPRLALELDADGLHVGQDDLPVPEARGIVGEELLIGLSTHSAEELRAGRASGADQLSVGPVWATPTKPGRPPTGLGLLEVAASELKLPWFAIGGVEFANLGQVLDAGASRVCVVRAIQDAGEPEAAARALRTALSERVAA